MKGSALFVTSLFLVLLYVDAHCPNMCSGHGSCGPDDICTCYNGFTYPDCSARLCRQSRAWYKAAAKEEEENGHGAHILETECSNAGLCDRKSGHCKCFSGWTGTACERLLCPGNMNCNGHGTCETLMEQNALRRNQHGDEEDNGEYKSVKYTQPLNELDGTGATAARWDADKIVGCDCDFGWTNYDCSYRLCPRGDDPILVDSKKETTTLTFDAGAEYAAGSTFRIEYYGKWTDPITFNSAEELPVLEERISEALHRHPYIKDVTVDVTAYVTTNQGATMIITFNQIHSMIFLIDGSEEDKSDFNPDGPTIACYPAACSTETAVETQAGSYQHEECSRRGMCDSSTGLCKCFEGYTGDACEVQSSLAF